MDGSTIDLDAFGIGQPVRRREDRRFITGAGRFTDDINVPRQAYGYVLRSPVPHARILRINTEGAKSAPSVIAVLTGAEYQADGHAPITHAYS